MTILKILKGFLISVLLLTVIGIAWFWTPDTNYAEMLNKYLEPQPSFTELSDGTRIHYADKGNPEGVPLLMIHGTSDSLLTWQALEKELGAEFRLISLDLPGHGFSSAPDNPSFDFFTNTAVELLTTLGIERAVWIGNSLGGGIAWRAALTHPEHVSALVLLDPSGAPRTTPAKSNIGFRLLANPVGRFLGRHITPRALIEQSLVDTVADPDIVTSELVDRYWELLRLPGNRQALAKLASLRRSDNSWSQIDQVNTPTLIIWGAEDQVTPAANAEKFAKAIPNSTLIMYEKVGHLPMVEAPERLGLDIQKFVSEVATAQ